LRVFRLYDFNSDGYLDVNDMRVLGWALSLRQRVPEPHEASLQIQRADVDGDLLLSVDEFLRHSLALSRIPEHDFALLMRLLEESHAVALRTGLIAALQGGGVWDPRAATAALSPTR
jgi:hypothetical protein